MKDTCGKTTSGKHYFVIKIVETEKQIPFVKVKQCLACGFIDDLYEPPTKTT